MLPDIDDQQLTLTLISPINISALGIKRNAVQKLGSLQVLLQNIILDLWWDLSHGLANLHCSLVFPVFCFISEPLITLNPQQVHEGGFLPQTSMLVFEALSDPLDLLVKFMQFFLKMCTDFARLEEPLEAFVGSCNHTSTGQNF